MKKNFDFLIIGNFRSGTSFLSNIINSNKRGYCVYDPFIFLIKIYNLHIQKKNKSISSINIDLDHYIKNNKIYENSLFTNLKKKFSFKENISIKDRFLFINILKKIKSYQHPNLKEILITKKKMSFRIFFKHCLHEFKRVNSKKTQVVTGTKISWCEEYIPVFKKAYPKIKILFIYRDIKSIISSAINSEKFGKKAVRPILYYIFFWKKSILLSRKYKNHLYIIKYEKLISKFNQEAKNIYKYLGLKNIKIKKLYDQFDFFWTPNTSYKVKRNKKIIDTQKHYKKMLDKELIDIIDYLCKDELNLLGYKVNNKKKINKNIIKKILKKYDSKNIFGRKYRKYLNYNKCLDNLI